MSAAIKPCRRPGAHRGHVWCPPQSRIIYTCPGRGIFRTRALEGAR